MTKVLNRIPVRRITERKERAPRAHFKRLALKEIWMNPWYGLPLPVWRCVLVFNYARVSFLVHIKVKAGSLLGVVKLNARATASTAQGSKGLNALDGDTEGIQFDDR
jgi:hypothetical protein